MLCTAAQGSASAALALELKPIRVNVVSPGVVDTPTWAFLGAEDRRGLFDSVAASLPVGRVGSADDLADAALSMMGNGFINGTCCMWRAIWSSSPCSTSAGTLNFFKSVVKCVSENCRIHSY
jgi:NAD(P)-dependent dehydrogenase (short-subunit alcohol dehydrogenase family)